MATHLKPAAHGELDRLRGLVAEQHRRLGRARRAGPGRPRRCVAEPLPPRCAKPRLTARGPGAADGGGARPPGAAGHDAGRLHWSAWPERRPEVPVLRPSPGLAAYGLRGVPDLPNLVLALFGGRRARSRPRSPGRWPSSGRASRSLPVFLTNDPDFTPLREQRLAFEYFPFELDEAAPPPEPRWAAYFVATLELTMRRWGVRQVVML